MSCPAGWSHAAAAAGRAAGPNMQEMGFVCAVTFPPFLTRKMIREERWGGSLVSTWQLLDALVFFPGAGVEGEGKGQALVIQDLAAWIYLNSVQPEDIRR